MHARSFNVEAKEKKKEKSNHGYVVWIESTGLKARYVCCSGFKEFLECSHHTIRRQCGDDTAQFAKEFLDRMSSSLLRVNICYFCREREREKLLSPQRDTFEVCAMPQLSRRLLENMNLLAYRCGAKHADTCIIVVRDNVLSR